MEKLIKALMLIILLTLITPQPTLAQEEQPSEPSCSSLPPVSNLTCNEWQTSVAINWTNSTTLTFGTNYRLSWNRQGYYSCPAGSPASDCGSILVNTAYNEIYGHGFSTLVTGLTQTKMYNFTINYENTAQNYCPIDQTISCMPTVCGDQVKGTTEACDAPDFAGQTCQSKGFESGNLLCINSCRQIATSSCTPCNTISNVSMSNGINSMNVVATNSSFKCFVDAAHQGPAIICEVISWDNQTGQQTGSSECTFSAWSGNRAEFNCIAPATASSNTVSYPLRARYPVNNDPKSTGSANIYSCPASTNATGLTVFSPTTTPPTVSVVETYANYLNENPLQELKVNITCNPAHKMVGCDTNSYKLKKITSQPSSCPQDYSQYDLTSPYQPNLTKTAWFCAAAKDALGNIGFAPVLEVRPGCRDQCQMAGDQQCVPNGKYFASSSCASSWDSDACFELGGLEDCTSKWGCSYGSCIQYKEPVGYGSTNIGGIRVFYSSPRENGGTTSNFDGTFLMRASQSDTFNIKPQVPPGLKLTKTTCIEYIPSSAPWPNQCNPPATQDMTQADGSCSLVLGFNFYSGSSEYCNTSPNLAFNFAPTDTSAPTISFAPPSPSNPDSTTAVSLTANASDNTGIRQIEIYLDGGLVKRCQISNLYNPATNGSCTYTATLAVGTYQYYAKAYDTVVSSSQTASQSLTVVAPPPASATGCGSAKFSRATGLVSSLTIQNFSTTGGCVISPRAAFLQIPTYGDLKSIYYDQSKAPSSQKIVPLTGDRTETDLSLTDTNGRLYYIKKTNPSSTDGNLTLSGSISGSEFGIIFVDGNLNINSGANNLGSTNSGLVFVVKGNVNIAQSVTRVDAVIIAEGKIYTAGASCSQTTPVSSSQLVINGSFISLSEGSKIEFCRTLSDNSQPAEKINHQVKYLVILKDLLSDTIQKWSEIP